MSTDEALIFALPRPDIAAWRAGNTGTEGVWHFDSGRSGRHVMISALVHGNELCGAWALKLTLAFCNLAAFDSFDVANHDASRFVQEDLNRQWIHERMQSATTLERRRAEQLRPYVEAADWLLDLHSMHERGAPLLLTGTCQRNIELARVLGTPEHVVVDVGHQDGVRMRDFGRFGLPDAQAPDTRSLLIECGFHGDLQSRTVAQDMCVRFLVAAGLLYTAEEAHLLPGWRQTQATGQWALRVTDQVVARSERFCFTEAFQGLEIIEKAGTVIGHHDGKGLGLAVTTPYDQCVLVMPSVRQAKAGVTVVRLATRQSI
jgi:hypothetical protein